MALMALVLFIGGNALAQSTPPPVIVNGGYALQSGQTGCNNTDNVSYDAAFAGEQDIYTYRDEVHLLQTWDGKYYKVTLTHRVSVNTNSNYVRTEINSGQFYQLRQQYEGNSSFHSIPDAYDWD